MSPVETIRIYISKIYQKGDKIVKGCKVFKTHTTASFCFSRLQLVVRAVSFDLMSAGDDTEVLAVIFEPGLYFSRLIARRFFKAGALYLMRASSRSFARLVAGLNETLGNLSLHQATWRS